MPTCVRSFSKINLGLRVGPLRPDGFHGLSTIYQTIDLYDLVTVHAEIAPTTTIILDSNHPGVPCTANGDADKNTAYRMVQNALQQLGLTAKVHVQIEKKLPVQGGMGAGSANAVAALLGLEVELKKALPAAERLALAAEIGSDVPLFLIGGTVLGIGRGEQVYPLPDIPATPCVIAIPEVGVSTKLAFAELDKRQDPSAATHSLTFAQGEARLEELSRTFAGIWSTSGLRSRQISGPTGIAGPHLGDLQEFPSGRSSDLAENPLLALVRTGMENDFEEVAFSQHPSLRQIKRELAGIGDDAALCAMLSGSGSALFGLYGSQGAAEAAQRRVEALGCRALVTTTLTRSRFRSTVFAG